MREHCICLLTIACQSILGGERPVFQTLRYNEDWSVLQDASRRDDPLDALKFIPLDGTNIYLSLGGEGRLKYERYDTLVLNQKPENTDGFLLQRYLLHGDVHVGSHFRAFGQLQTSLVDFRDGGPRPTDEDALDLHQAFFDVSEAWSLDGQATLRAGRQEMAYGSQRLVSVRESPNNRLSFDAIRLLTHFEKWQADAWLAEPVEIDTGIFDDQRIQETLFWGGYLSGPVSFVSGLQVDFYYLGLSRENARFARGTANELRHSIGSRLFGKRGALDWNFEFVGQFGSFGNKEILAWTTASDTGWTFSNAPAKPRLFLRADIASGDHGGSSLGTFNPLFPRGAYFNEASLIGPQNLMDLQPGVDIAITKSIKFAGSCDFVWRESLEDGVYGVALNLQTASGVSRQRYVGTFPNASVSWQASRHLNLAINYVAYLFGGFINDAAPLQKNGNYLSVVATFRF